MNNTTYLLSILALAAALISTSAPLQAGVYRWVDDQGVVHFSQTPPPEAETRQPVTTPPPPATSESEAWEDLNRQVKEMQDRQDIHSENALAEKEQKTRDASVKKNCETAERTLRELGSGSPMRVVREDGNRRITDKEREAHLKKAHEMKEKYCTE